MDPGISLICTWIIFSGSVIGNYVKLFSALRLRLKVTVILTLLRVFGPKRDEVTGNGENYIMRSLVICTPYPILCGW